MLQKHELIASNGMVYSTEESENEATKSLPCFSIPLQLLLCISSFDAKSTPQANWDA